MGLYKRKANSAKNKKYGKARRTRNYRKDTDQIQDDLKPENVHKLSNLKIDEDLPGLGQHYCAFCARYFVSMVAMNVHSKSKDHKKAIRRAQEKVHTQKDSDNFGKF